MNAVITGATKGIGKAIAEIFLQNELNVAINARNADDLTELTESWKSSYKGLEIISKPTDMSKKDQVQSFASFVQSSWDKVDILVNNAGVFLPGEIHSEADGTLETLIDTNLYSAYHLSRALVPSMIERQSGIIVNICSVASIKALPNSGSYCISKYAMLGFSKSLREELKDKGIKVISILPGGTWSNSWSGSGVDEERLMKASDIASTVWQACQLSDRAVIEEIILRPQLGDL